jgi:hypothetical protein
MLHFSDLDLNPDRRRLRQFAGASVFFLCACAWRSHWHLHLTAAWTLTVAALAMGIIAVFTPQLLRPFYVAAMVLAYPIGWVVSRAVLCLLYYGLVTPIGFVLRLLRRDRLRLKRPSPGESCWTPRSVPAKPEGYLRQF